MRPAPLASDAGLTLVEVLVALTIVAVSAGAAVLGLGATGRGLNVEAEARRLAGRLNYAADETLVTDRALALQADSGGYRFVTPDPQGDWRPDGAELLGTRRDLPAGMTLVVEGVRDDAPAPVTADGAGRPLNVTISGAGRAWRVTFDGLNAAVVPGGAS